MKLSPKHQRIINQIIPFGVIWLLTGWVFLFVEVAAMGTNAPNAPTVINLTWEVFLFASIAVTIVGFLVGVVEIVYLEKRFRNKSFLFKIFGKFGVYTLLMLMVTFVTFPIAASFESNISILDARVWDKFGMYLKSVTFLSTLIQMTCSIMLCVIYTAISEHLGHSVLVNLLFGRYHRPKYERRIFMFLDMNESTSIAEQLGHIRYFELLSAYYENLSGAIVNHFGEVYQYIGDEIVISWKWKKGLLNVNCIRCFFAMEKALQMKSDFFKSQFGIIPSFKAGLHIGDVTTGEIGALKKEILFTGDVLNVTSRIQGLCNQYDERCIASNELVQQLPDLNGFSSKSLGSVLLKGKSEPVDLVSIEKIHSHA